MPNILVPENLDRRARQARAVNDAGVVQLVRENEVLFAENRAHRAGVGGKPALEDDARLDILEARDLLLKLHVDAHRAGDGSHCARTHAVFARRLQCRLDQLWMVRQPEVIVAGQIDHMLAVVVAHRRLLVVQHAEPEIGALGAQVVQGLGQVGKLRAGGRLSHRDSPQAASITP